MPITTAAGLAKALDEHRVLSPAQLAEVTSSLQGRFPDSRALARELLQRGWLTAFQVNQLVQGRGADLLLGPYVLLERIGEGGMGSVFKARHQLMDRTVALKVIRKEHLSHPDAVQRFHREIKMAAQLDHPHLVRAHDASQVGDTHFLVMEFAEGTDLQRLVQKSGPLPVGQACDYIRQAALGLQHAAERGLVHRDIKPSNLQVTGQGAVVKILDMGLARSMTLDTDKGAAPELTQNRTVMGTPDYMAPEQIVDPRRVDIRADIYSLGCTFYFLLAGHPPFPEGAWEEKLVSHRKVEPQPIEQLRPEVPKAVGAILRKMMAKQLANRYATATEVADALAPFSQLGAALPAAAGSRPGKRPGSSGQSTVDANSNPASPPILSAPTLLLPGQRSSPSQKTRPISRPPAPSSLGFGKVLALILGGGGAALGLLVLLVILFWPKGGDPAKTASAPAVTVSGSEKVASAKETVGTKDPHESGMPAVALTAKAPAQWLLKKVAVGAPFISNRNYAFSRVPDEIAGASYILRDSGDWAQWLPPHAVKADRDVTVYLILRSQLMGNEEVNEAAFQQLAREGWKQVQGEVEGTFNSGEGWVWKAVKRDYQRGDLFVHVNSVNLTVPIIFAFK